MDTISRLPGETDAELRQRLLDRPIAIKARAAIWRVFDMPDKDKTLFIEGVPIQMITFDMKDLVLWPNIVGKP